MARQGGVDPRDGWETRITPRPSSFAYVRPVTRAHYVARVTTATAAAAARGRPSPSPSPPPPPLCLHLNHRRRHPNRCPIFPLCHPRHRPPCPFPLASPQPSLKRTTSGGSVRVLKVRPSSSTASSPRSGDGLAPPRPPPPPPKLRPNCPPPTRPPPPPKRPPRPPQPREPPKPHCCALRLPLNP